MLDLTCLGTAESRAALTRAAHELSLARLGHVLLAEACDTDLAQEAEQCMAWDARVSLVPAVVDGGEGLSAAEAEVARFFALVDRVAERADLQRRGRYFAAKLAAAAARRSPA